MQVTLLNGNPDPVTYRMDDYVARLGSALEAENCTVTTFTLREMDIKYCTGCFGCWIKSPGLCQTKDDSYAVCRSVIHADMVLLAAPVIMGFPSALLKKMIDKLIPLVHPYFEVVEGEAHHAKRYVRYPRLGLLLEGGAHGYDCVDDEDIRIVQGIIGRTALNLKSSLSFTHMLNKPIEEVVNDILYETHRV